jgi:ACDE family multidrug resistance protein
MDQRTETRLSGDSANRQRGPLAVTFGASIAVVGGSTLLYPVLPVLAGDLGVAEGEIGLAMAAFFAPAIVLAPIFGIIADLRGRRWMLICGLVVFGLAGSALAFAPSFVWVVALRAVQGIGMSAMSPLTIVLISDLLPPERELHGQGLKVVFDRIAMIILPVLGGALAALSWRVSVTPFLLALPLAAIAYFYLPETSKPGSDSLGAYLKRTIRAIREPRLITAFMTGFLRFFLDTGLYTYLPLMLALRKGLSAETAGWLIAASAAGSIVTAISIGRIKGGHREQRLLAIAFLASAAALAIIACNGALWTIAAAAFVFGLGNGVISPLQKSLLTQRTEPNLRGGVVSVDRVIQQVGKSLAPVLAGLLLLVAPIEWVFWSLCVASLLGAGALAATGLQSGKQDEARG